MDNDLKIRTSVLCHYAKTEKNEGPGAGGGRGRLRACDDLLNKG